MARWIRMPWFPSVSTMKRRSATWAAWTCRYWASAVLVILGFNEPGSAPNSGTRLVTLDDLTRNDASRDFGGKQNVPTKAITMGIGTIFKAREIILMAWSGKKAPIIKKAVEGEISGEVPATYLQLSDHVEFILDEDAASELTRFKHPLAGKRLCLG